MLQSLMTELDATLTNASGARRLSILQGVTDLLLEHADVFSAEHVAVFDDVISRLIKGTDEAALAELSRTLVPLGNPPLSTVAALAGHDSIAVAGPLLEKSAALTDETLAAIAESASHKHLLLLATRAGLGEQVTDILVERGNAEIAARLAANPGAKLSELGFVKLINRAKTDVALAGTIAARTDIPPELEPFLKLTLV